MDLLLHGRAACRLRLLTLALFAFFILGPFAPHYYGSLYSVWFRVLALVLLTLYFRHRGLRDGWEVRLLSGWCLWAVLVQMLHGDLSLLDSWEYLFHMACQILWLVPPLLLEREERLRLVDGLARIFTLVFSLLAVLCLYGALTGVELSNPLTGELLYSFGEDRRLYALGQSTNVVGHWFFLDFWLLVWLFLRSRRPLFRLLTLPGAILAWLGIALTVSRNSMLGFSVCAGLGLAMLLLKRLPLRRRQLQALVLLAVLGLSVPLLWKSFHGATLLVSELHNKITAEPSPELPAVPDPAPEAPAQPQTTPDFYTEGRGLKDTGRIPIYKAALQVLAEDPLRLLIGEPDSMGATNARLQEWYQAKIISYVAEYAHHHCSYLQVLMSTGLPGFGLMLGFLVLLLWKMGRLFFRAGPAEPALSALLLCLLGMGQYNLLDTYLFYALDCRGILFFLLAGTVIACAREIPDPAEKCLDR